MAVHVPRLAVPQTSLGTRHVFVGMAVLRGVVAGGAVLLAPWLYREHAAVLVLMRPTKEVFLFAGFMVRRGDVGLPLVLVAALPILLGGVWIFFGLGRAYEADLEESELPGVAGRVLPKDRIDQLRDVLERKGTRVVFLGRLAAFPSSLMAAAAGSSGVSWRRFIVADTAGAVASLALAVGLGHALEGAYEDAGPWLTALGVAVAVVLAVLVGRSVMGDSSSSA
jgi:membrane protein DedA with SNARE-associated domain